ncbi:AAA family ATPase [Anaeromyxobacter sp. SG26]|uniref:AAA family ATPase n=1 Tax=Anaeromyxobacter sp. SG26 TaxID=2925407 RepID=UPI001F5A93D2|nr:AAA family ATPase [Anaeromyxobacter sp. SG26]
MPIEKILKVDNVGRFTRLRPKGDVQFRRLTLLYGQNGHGKTTLAGIIRSLQSGDPAYVAERARLGGAAPIIQLRVDGVTATYEDGKWSAAATDLEIFDSTFVTDNVYAGEHVEPEQRKNLYQVVVGASAVALARRIDEIDAESRAAAREVGAAEGGLREIIQAPFSIDDFVELKPERNVAEAVGEITTKLSAARKSKEVLARREPEPFVVPGAPSKTLEVLAKSVEQLSKDAEARVRQHVAVRLDTRGEQWVRQGLQYLKEDATCPFCTQDTSGVELVELFRKFFSEGYREHVVEIERALNLVEQALGEQVLHGIQKKALENDARIRVWADLVDVGYARASLTGFETAARKLRGLLVEALKQKLANPSAAVSDSPELEAALRDYDEGRAELRRVNQEISRAADAVASVKKDAAAVDEGKLEQELRRLRNMQIRERPEGQALCDSLVAARSKKKALEDEKRDKRRELEELAAAELSNCEAAINELLANFGASFRIVETRPAFPGGKASSTYRIAIDKKPLDLGDSRTPRGVPCFRTALSAGDKSTLALAFFIARLKRDPKLKNKAVVFDDPLSSLDDFRRSCTVGEVTWIARNAAQAVVLSHDAAFLKAVYDANEKATLKTLEIVRDQSEYLLREWDIVRSCRHVTHQAYFTLRRFLDAGAPENGNLRVIAQEIRPYLEGSLRHLFPEEFPEDKWLGDFIEALRSAAEGSKLAGWRGLLTDIAAVNDYSKKFHHAGAGTGPVPNEAELRAHVERALKIVQGS